MPGSSQLSGPAAYDVNDLRFVAETESGGFPCSKGTWYIARDEIEERSLSRKDGIDTSKEYELRKSYCTFLKDLGNKLRMPHVVIATSTVFSHRFFLHQSHHKNDRYTIATACMFLAGKVEEARRALEDVVLVSYCLQNKNNPMAAQDFKEKEVCERQKELVLLAEHMVLVTLDFELKVRHPHSFVLQATSEYKFASEALIPVSYIILNDVLYTTLCLQFKPQHIAASALLLAAKLLKFKFPCKGWWKQFNVTPHQLEGICAMWPILGIMVYLFAFNCEPMWSVEICSQILELYERERTLFLQSGSSSSSVDDKAHLLPPVTAVGNLRNHSTSKGHLLDNSGAFPTNSSLTKSNNHKSTLVVRPPPTALPTTRPKWGFKEIPNESSKDTKVSFKDSEAPLKRKRPEDQVVGDLQHANKHKPTAAPRKGSKGLPTRSK